MTLKRDEVRRFGLIWFVAGGGFAFVSVWAVYDDMVTRAPWKQEQYAFFDVEADLARVNLGKAQKVYRAKQEPRVRALESLRGRLQNQSKQFDAQRAELARLDAEYAEREQDKTFAKSDQDEVYYYRNLAEYERDEAEGRAREAVARAVGDRLFGDPPHPPPRSGESAATTSLRYEIARAELRIGNVERALAQPGQDVPPEARPALERAREGNVHTRERLEEELRYQLVMDDAQRDLDRMERDRQRLRDQMAPCVACRPGDGPVVAGIERPAGGRCQEEANPAQAPLDLCLAAVGREISAASRDLDDARRRLETAESRANPRFDVSALIPSIVSVEQIQQVVTNWREHEDVDRCSTCHMGADSANYTSPSVPRQFRTHPAREWILASHPVERFGCTSCHQGQGRATEEWYAHSPTPPTAMPPDDRGHREISWHREGDHYWEEPLFATGTVIEAVVGARNDELVVEVAGASRTIKLSRGLYRSAESLAANLQKKLRAGPDGRLGRNRVLARVAERVGAGPDEAGRDDDLSWSAFVDQNRIVIERRNADGEQPEDMRFTLRFPERGTRELLGFTVPTGWVSNEAPVWRDAATYRATHPVMPPVRSDGPRGTDGMQVPERDREAFLLSVPYSQSGCARCHARDADLRPLRSVSHYLDQRAEHAMAATAARARGEEPAAFSPVDPRDNTHPEAVPDLAPMYTEGRALFRDLNCTGCHILDNYPGDRNAGPQLNAIADKVSTDWLFTWLRYPRAWRPHTRMPNLWPWPLNPETHRPYAAGSPEHRVWERRRDEEVTAIAAYLIERSQDLVPEGYGNVEGATAEAGRQLFESVGCRGCHTTAATEADRPPAWSERERDRAPNLSNIGSKSNLDFLTSWIENPSHYWTDTQMPNLRLTRQESASIAAYLMTLRDAEHPVDRAPAALNDAAARARLVDRGHQLIANYGCFGCHNIAGFEGYAPIAPELNNFARKDISTLDFGYAITNHHEHTWDTYTVWKLDAPRIYRRDRVELRMGDYDLSPREIRALMVFLRATGEERVRPNFVAHNDEDYALALQGRQLVEDLNCRGCHILEGRGGDIRAFYPGDQSRLAPPNLRAQGFKTQPEWFYEFLRNPWLYRERPGNPATAENLPNSGGVRPWLAVRMPTFHLSPEEATAIVRYLAATERQDFPYQRGPEMSAHLEPARMRQGEQLFHQLQCYSCHIMGERLPEGNDPGQWAPNLLNVQARLRHGWTHRWIEDPNSLYPGTVMPAFWDTPFGGEDANPFASVVPGNAQAAITLLTDYLYQMDRSDYVRAYVQGGAAAAGQYLEGGTTAAATPAAPAAPGAEPGAPAAPAAPAAPEPAPAAPPAAPAGPGLNPGTGSTTVSSRDR
ncbi:MAG: c-type cytochrome [Deltaproteobacteria bacterium]|nr:c-type cytochrome [Deltaproteobacteria bacterium]